MDRMLLNILVCPHCHHELTCHAVNEDERHRVVTGSLTCTSCHKIYPIVRSIPRFVPMHNYAESFGYQWNKFKYTQLDIYSQFDHSRQRFYAETKWSKQDLEGNLVLEAGCGNGRFLDICGEASCEVVGVDISYAIDAAQELFKNRANIHLLQASIYELPFKPAIFDKCYSIGVIQHTPDPKKTLSILPQWLKTGGKLAVTIYEKKPWTLLYGKYLIRPLTKRLNKKFLLFAIHVFSIILFPLTEILFRLPLLNKFFKFIIPYANYVDIKELTLKQRYEWAILDTFDMLSPKYDYPMTEHAIRSVLTNKVHDIKRLPNKGVNLIATR